MNGSEDGLLRLVEWIRWTPLGGAEFANVGRWFEATSTSNLD